MSRYFLIVLFLTFAASGLQYSVLGTVWPMAYSDFGVAVSMIGYINMILAPGRILSSIYTDKLVQRFGTYKVAVFGFALICLSIFGYGNSTSYVMLCMFSIPLGFGEDFFLCAINSFSALHMKAKYTNWLNMVWSLGASAGPYIISVCLMRGATWRSGYLVLAVIQSGILFLFLTTRSGWREYRNEQTLRVSQKSVKSEKIALKGMLVMMTAFFCYTAIETTSMLWGASYITMQKGLSEEAGALGTMFLFVGMTAGRLIAGFMAERLGDRMMIHIGQTVIIVSALMLLLLSGQNAVFASMLFMGIGCAPVFPCFIHYIPAVFGMDKGGRVISVLMGGSQVATLLMPVIFGWGAEAGGMWLYPVFQIIFAAFMMALLIWQRSGAVKS